jgi:hypothetical protein
MRGRSATLCRILRRLLHVRSGSISQRVSCLPSLDWPRRRSLGHATRASGEGALAGQRIGVRPRRPAQPLHRRRSVRAIDPPHSPPRARGTQIPIARAAPPHVRPARFPPLEAFGRRPSACAAPSLIGPASETLHKGGSRPCEPIQAHRAKLRLGSPSGQLAHVSLMQNGFARRIVLIEQLQ